MEGFRFYCRTAAVVLMLAIISLAQAFYNVAARTPMTPWVRAAQVEVPVSEAGLVSDYTLPPISDGMVPVLLSVPTKQPVVFLGIDDGQYQDRSVIDLLRRSGVRASLFLNDHYTAENPPFFKQLERTGSIIENHTINHLDLTALNYNQQVDEICGNADRLAAEFGRRPTMFRPPYGSYNDDTRRAAAACGMRALIQWHAKVNNGSVQYQDGDRLVAGDIVLMHFRPEFAQDLKAYQAAVKASGLQTVLLEDWLK